MRITNLSSDAFYYIYRKDGRGVIYPAAFKQPTNNPDMRLFATGAELVRFTDYDDAVAYLEEHASPKYHFYISRQPYPAMAEIGL